MFLQPWKNRNRNWIENFFEDDFFKSFLEPKEGGFYPEMDIKSIKDKYLISLDLPGLSKEDVHIKLDNNILTITGERKTEKSDILRSERSYGKFERTLRLDNEINMDDIKAEFSNGVLEISIPKSIRGDPKTIEIK